MTIKHIDFQQKQEWEREMKAVQDCYGIIGCCLTCTASDKEEREGYQQDLFYEGKYYRCVCYDCKCKKCSWYFNRECQRKGVIV